jgi:hypothetical protein
MLQHIKDETIIKAIHPSHNLNLTFQAFKGIVKHITTNDPGLNTLSLFLTIFRIQVKVYRNVELCLRICRKHDFCQSAEDCQEYQEDAQ